MSLWKEKSFAFQEAHTVVTSMNRRFDDKSFRQNFPDTPATLSKHGRRLNDPILPIF